MQFVSSSIGFHRNKLVVRFRLDRKMVASKWRKILWYRLPCEKSDDEERKIVITHQLTKSFNRFSLVLLLSHEILTTDKGFSSKSDRAEDDVECIESCIVRVLCNNVQIDDLYKNQICKINEVISYY